MKEPRFRVIIVGGGIGGLALANVLQHAGVDYVLIEKAKALDPQVGASIGILPNGARLLDQIGCFDDLAPLTVDMVSTASHAADGSLIGDVSDTLSLMKRRTGYPVFFIDRQLLLRVLARHIWDHSRVLLETRVESVEQDDEKVTVRCADGTTLDADIVVGADGVHSFVRQEMWKHADVAGEGKNFAEDKKAMSAEYKCLFGISSSIAGMEPGQTDRTYAHGLSTLSYVGKEGRVFWFVFIKMDRVYHPPDIPRFTEQDVEMVIAEHGTVAIRPDNAVTIADLRRHQICCNLVAIEEAEYQQWSYGRLVCMGDSIHKMTPNLGAGASSAIESAAVLANFIVPLALRSTKPPLSAIRFAVEEYQKNRTLRVGRAMKSTNKLTRVQALQTHKDYIFAHYIAPYMDDTYAEAFSSFVIGAPLINHLPIPKRSLEGTMPFNPRQGWGYEEAMSARVWRALPFLVIACLSFQYTSSLSGWIQRSFLGPWYRNNAVNFVHNVDLIQTRDLTLSIHAIVTYGIWLIEGTRLSNKASLIQLPLLFGLGWQYLGYKATVPLYFFLLYIQSPIEKFRASDIRLTDVSYTRSIGPLIHLIGVMPKYVRFNDLLGNYGHKHIGEALSRNIHQSQLSSLLLISALQFLVARLLRPSTIRSDRIQAVDRDVTCIRYTTIIFGALTSLTWIRYLATPGLTSIQGNSASHSVHMLGEIFGSEGLLMTTSLAFWLFLTYRDLRKAGMIATKWGTILLLGVFALTICGPGGMFVLGWRLREEVLLHRRHRDAVVTR